MRAALITGGTSGIGLAFARALARQGHPLIVVARDHDRLATVSADLASAFGVSVETLAADLSDRADVDRVAARLRTGDVDILITGTGNTRVVTVDHLRALKHLAIVGNVGHFDDEIDIAGLEAAPPDILLFAGGTDGGNTEYVLANAQAIAASKIEGGHWQGAKITE